MTTSNTFATTARDDPTGLIGMVEAGASCHATKMAWGGVSGGHAPSHRNGGDKKRMRGTAALIEMGVMPWNPGGRYAFLYKGVGIKVPDCFKGRKTVQLLATLQLQRRGAGSYG